MSASYMFYIPGWLSSVLSLSSMFRQRGAAVRAEHPLPVHQVPCRLSRHHQGGANKQQTVLTNLCWLCKYNWRSKIRIQKFRSSKWFNRIFRDRAFLRLFPVCQVFCLSQDLSGFGGSKGNTSTVPPPPPCSRSPSLGMISLWRPASLQIPIGGPTTNAKRSVSTTRYWVDLFNYRSGGLGRDFIHWSENKFSKNQ
jgi:hypothetical protein